MIDKSAITAVFEALAPERVSRGLANADGHTWEDCFLARAYGAPGELERAIRRAPSGEVANLLRPAPKATDAANLLGVDLRAVFAVLDAFDHHPREFRHLAEEWLEETEVRGRPRLEDRCRPPGRPSAALIDVATPALVVGAGR
jgi:hypothetical protein